jgi:hypothetical protein
MSNTIGLDGDLDDVELLRELEAVFDIAISDEEAWLLVTVGDVEALLLRRIPANEADRKCASAMACYRLRGALERLGHGERLAPVAALPGLARGRVRAKLKRLERESGLRLPAAPATRLGCLMACVVIAAMTAGAFWLMPSFPALIGGGALGLFVAVVMLRLIDPGRLPDSCATLAGLARVAAVLNHGRLIRAGARHRAEDIWATLLEVLSIYDLPKAEITRETYLLHSQWRKRAA